MSFSRVLFVLAVLVGIGSTGDVWTQRDLSSSFPKVRTASDTEDILKDYQVYLDYVLEVSRETDATTAKRLTRNFQTLKKRNPELAARFLKGLRFEMQQKLEFMGVTPEKASSRSPEIRKWVTKFVKEWDREADEYLFRAIALRERE